MMLVRRPGSVPRQQRGRPHPSAGGRSRPAAGARGSQVPLGERGSVTAELAVAFPAVAVVLIFGVSALMAAGTQVRLQDAAADAARLAGRGEPAERSTSVVSTAVPGAVTAIETRGDLVCATATVEARVAGLVTVPLSAESCALGGGL